jgi:antitoxin MazE
MSAIQKWGNSLAVRIPAPVAEQINIQEGCPVEIEAVEGAIVVRPKRQRKYQLSELLKDCTPTRLHGEFDFGPDVGNESID